jgi:hypothetical protein
VARLETEMVKNVKMDNLFAVQSASVRHVPRGNRVLHGRQQGVQ